MAVGIMLSSTACSGTVSSVNKYRTSGGNAQLYLAHYYLTGVPGPKYTDPFEVDRVVDIKKAYTWYQRAAENGDADAQFYLGVMYDTSYRQKHLLYKKNLVRASMWYFVTTQNPRQSVWSTKAAAEIRLNYLEMVNRQVLQKAIGPAKKCIRKEYKGC